MALVSSASVLQFLELSADDSYSTVSSIQTGIEAAIKTYCRRNLESTTYKDTYSDINNYVVLKDYPVTVISKIANTTTAPMYVKNSNQFTSAVVSVTTTRVNLVYNGTTYAGDLTFATNTTLSTLSTAINAAGNGWSSEIYSSDFNGILSTELLPMFGANAIYNRQVSLLIPSGDYPDIDVDDIKGILRSKSTIAEEFRNIYVNYTAGYTTIPSDLQFATKLWIKDIYQRHQEKAIGVSEYWIAGMRKVFEEIPPTVKTILEKYKRVLV